MGWRHIIVLDLGNLLGANNTCFVNTDRGHRRALRGG